VKAKVAQLEAQAAAPDSGKRSAAKAALAKLVLQCIICLSQSTDVKWFEMDIVDGELVCKGDLCHPCGTTADAWPLLERAELVRRYKQDPVFHTQFLAAKKVVMKQVDGNFVVSAVTSATVVGFRSWRSRDSYLALSRHRFQQGRAAIGFEVCGG
jgi:hypothetical protein